jgi:hypothetical protein
MDAHEATVSAVWSWLSSDMRVGDMGWVVCHAGITLHDCVAITAASASLRRSCCLTWCR